MFFIEKIRAVLGVARNFDWGDRKPRYLALLMNLKKHS